MQPSTAVLPKVLHNVLCSQACHGRSQGVTPTNPSDIGYYVQEFRPKCISRLKNKAVKGSYSTYMRRCRRDRERLHLERNYCYVGHRFNLYTFLGGPVILFDLLV